MCKQKKSEIITWLRKQRDGFIIGDYRNILYNLYQKISFVLASQEICNLNSLIDINSIYYKSKNQLLEFCEDLRNLGYININYTSEDINITINKEIDF
nr:MAG TPA: hypothetical protein [Caudoviricetes sp.]